MRTGFLTCVAVIIVMLLASCASSQRRSGDTATPLGRPSADDLRRRAEQLWTARTAEDWATAFLFEDPRQRERMVESEYIAWCQENEPFDIHEFHLGSVQTEQQLGWVEADYRTALRRFPDMPPREVKRWEKWRIVEGQWYPVPRRELDHYPEAPARRDAAEEARLRQRFEEAWRAREKRDWGRLYELTDPRDHERVTQEELAEREGLFQYLSCELQWVEVVGNRGRIRVVYEIKLTDPSMTKMPPRTTQVAERWVKYEDDWYLDLGTGR